MASFPILTRDPELHDKLDAHEPAVLAYRRGPLVEPASDPFRAPRSIADVGGLDKIPLPAVVLELPDLKSTSYLRRGGQIPFASHAYWVALVFGALFALWLLLSGPKHVERPTEEAPTWTGQAAPPADRAISTWGANTGETSAPAPKWRASDIDATEQESTPTNPYDAPPHNPTLPGDAPHDALEPAAPALPGVGTAPQIGESAVAPAQQSEAIRTARGGETRWDGTSNRIQPSEAAPLGITISVPQ
jgi:hypothetical protein